MKIFSVVSFLVVITLFSSFAQSTWVRFGNELTGIATGDDFGAGVRLSNNGNTLLVSSGGYDQPYNDGGRAVVYQFTDSAWVQKGSNLVGDGLYQNYGGCSALSADANTIVIGNPKKSSALYNEVGSVKVFQWDGTDWAQKGNPLVGENEWEHFGSSVDLNAEGNRLIVGTPRKEVIYSGAGCVRVYDWGGTEWIQIGSTLTGSVLNDWFGSGVKMSADGLSFVVGAIGGEGSGVEVNSGRVVPYTWNSSLNDWVIKGQPLTGDAGGDLFGGPMDISFDAETVAVGGTQNDFVATDAGHVKVFRWIGTTWQQLGNTLYGKNEGDLFGSSVSLSQNGLVLAVGSMLADKGDKKNCGIIRTFRLVNNEWTLLGEEIYGDTKNSWLSSVSLDFEGKFLATGAIFDDTGTPKGRVKTYYLCDEYYTVDSAVACGSYTWIDGITYTSSNDTSKVIFKNDAGCDSTIALHLTITTVNTDIVVKEGMVSAEVDSASYQWIDCDANNTVIPREVFRQLTAVDSGSFAVIITQNGCVDTSECVSSIDIDGVYRMIDVISTPNPTTEDFIIRLDKTYAFITMSIFDSSNHLLYMEQFENKNEIAVQKELLKSGVNFIKINDKGESYGVCKVILTN